MPSAMRVLTTRWMPRGRGHAVDAERLRDRDRPRPRRRRGRAARGRRGNCRGRDSRARGWRRSRSPRRRPGRSRRARARRRRSAGPTCSTPPASTRAIEPPPAPMLTMSSACSADPLAGEPAVGGDWARPPADQRDVGAGAAHVEQDQVGLADQARARGGCRRRRRPGPESTRAGGEAHRLGDRRDAAVRLDDQDRAGDSPPRAAASRAGRDSAPAPGRHRR